MTRTHGLRTALINNYLLRAYFYMFTFIFKVRKQIFVYHTASESLPQSINFHCHFCHDIPCIKEDFFGHGEQNKMADILQQKFSENGEVGLGDR